MLLKEIYNTETSMLYVLLEVMNTVLTGKVSKKAFKNRKPIIISGPR